MASSLRFLCAHACRRTGLLPLLVGLRLASAARKQGPFQCVTSFVPLYLSERTSVGYSLNLPHDPLHSATPSLLLVHLANGKHTYAGVLRTDVGQLHHLHVQATPRPV